MCSRCTRHHHVLVDIVVYTRPESTATLDLYETLSSIIESYRVPCKDGSTESDETAVFVSNAMVPSRGNSRLTRRV
jgi:hypothetical protein